MKQGIHPKMKALTAICSCGHKIAMLSTYPKTELKLDVCNRCHPFFTGKQRVVDSGGRVDRFKKRFGGLAPQINQ